MPTSQDNTPTGKSIPKVMRKWEVASMQALDGSYQSGGYNYHVLKLRTLDGNEAKLGYNEVLLLRNWLNDWLGNHGGAR